MASTEGDTALGRPGHGLEQAEVGTGTAEDAALVLHLPPFLVRVGVPDDAAADAVLGLPPLPVHPDRPDGDVELHGAVGRHDADGPGVDATAVALERLDDLGRADLGRPRDRGTREEGVEDLTEAGIRVGDDGGGHGVDRRIGLDRVQGGHLHRA